MGAQRLLRTLYPSAAPSTSAPIKSFQHSVYRPFSRPPSRPAVRFGRVFNHPSRRVTVAMASSGPVRKSEEEWRAVLSPEQFRILRMKGTE